MRTKDFPLSLLEHIVSYCLLVVDFTKRWHALSKVIMVGSVSIRCFLVYSGIANFAPFPWP